MCESNATSVEHAPPRCLFPEQKDPPNNVDYRKNLITVPSCDIHNTVKSSDDEYLFHVLSASYTSSNIGLQQFITKGKRAFERNPLLVSKLTQTSASVMLRRQDDSEWEDGLAVSVRSDRLDTVLGNCARALYFHETTNKFLGLMRVITAFTMYTDSVRQKAIDVAMQSTESFYAEHLAHGDNPEVFWYKFAESERSATVLMCFYSHSKVVVKLDKVA